MTSTAADFYWYSDGVFTLSDDSGGTSAYSMIAASGSFALTGNNVFQPVLPWTPNGAYLVGYVVRANALQASGLLFRCIVAGVSGATEPSWPNSIGGIIVDGTVTWQAISSVYDELSKIAPSAIIELFQIQLVASIHGSNDIYYFHAGTNADVTGNITWNGQAYIRFPVQVEGFEYSSGGTLPRPTLSIANLGGEISALILLANATTPGNDLGGAKVTRIRTLKRYIDGQPTADPHAKFPDEIWYVDRKAAETRDIIQWELASKFDLAGMMVPKRQIIANVCQWQYRSAECSYAGPPVADANDNLLSSSAVPELQAYYNATAAYKAAKADRTQKASLLNQATNALNNAQSSYTLLSTRYSRLSSPYYYVRESTPGTQLLAVWNNGSVSLGSIYRQGLLRDVQPTHSGSRATPRLGAPTVRYYEIQQWQAVDTTALQSAYNTALSNYNTALSAEASALAAARAARDAYLVVNPQGGVPEDQCGKRLSSCRLRYFDPVTDTVGTLPFGSFPGAGLVS